MQVQAKGLVSLLRAIVLAAVTALLIASAALPMQAQSSVPPTARQAATIPQFAKRLAHPSPRPASPALARPGARRFAPQATIYDNGPINGTTDAWTINFGFVTSDTITITGDTSVNQMSFGVWLFPGDVLEAVEVSITSSEFGGTTYFDGVVNFTQSGCSGNQYGFNVCTASGSFSGPNLAGGTYWVNLSNALVNTGNPVYWDENSGVGCESSGCPSQASENSVGTIPSESFTMLGENDEPPACYGSQGNLHIIHDFTQQQTGGPFGVGGVTIDRAGNLYGTAAGGDNSAGLAYKLTHLGGWLFDPLFSFLGGFNGGGPGEVIVGPNGSLYGGAQGGIQNCGSDGSQYCGLVFNLRPQPTACLTALCDWTENVPYRFTSEADGTGLINVSASDQEGNLYGTTRSGGAHDAGTVFELTPSGAGWTKATLYSFTGGDDGSHPSQVLVGNDGNLYGVADAVVFQLTPSGGQWTESVLYTFQLSPSSLVQDSAGNLYGVLSSFGGGIFTLQKTGPGWAFSEYSPYHSCEPVDLPYDYPLNLTIDAAGNLYGTGTGGENFSRSLGRTSPGNSECFYNYFFKASYNSQGWHYQDLDFLLNQYFDQDGGVTVDASDNLYGTTYDCGANNSGTVWQLSP